MDRFNILLPTYFSSLRNVFRVAITSHDDNCRSLFDSIFQGSNVGLILIKSSSSLSIFKSPRTLLDNNKSQRA